MKAVSLTLTTIILIVILLATLLTILFFFTGGVEEIGGAIGNIGKGASGTSLTDPGEWFCDSNEWEVCPEVGACTGTYTTIEECENAISDPSNYRCECKIP